MKKLVAVLAAALVAPALVTAGAAPAAAKAAPRDPGTAVQEQFTKKGGVRLAETFRMTYAKQTLLDVRRTGLLRFGPGGVASFDVTTTAKDTTDKDAKKSTSRVIGVGGYGYSQDSATELPEGRKWVRFTDHAIPPSTLSVDILDPKVLKAVLATTKDTVQGGKVDGARTVVYRGSIDLKKLAKADKQSLVVALGGLAGKDAAKTLSWKLWIGADNLPRRFTSSYVVLTDKKRGDALVTTDVRFTGWGTRAEVKAPPAAEVIDQKDVPSPAEEEAKENFLIPFDDPYKNLKLVTG